MHLNPIASLSLAALAASSVLGVCAPAHADTAGPGRPVVTRTTTASTGTIVFIKSYDVWVSRPDGTGARALTTDGTADAPYDHPSISATGVIAAMKGGTIVRLRQDGTVLNRITPEDLFVPDYATVTISPIQGAEISPDGTKIAYSQLRLEHYGSSTDDYNYFVTEAETSFTDASQPTGPDKYGIVLGFSPSWVSNSRVALDVNGDVQLADLGHDAQPWFWSKDVFTDFIPLNEPEVSPDHQRVMFGTDGGFVVVAANGDPAGASPGKPSQFICGLSSDQGDPVAKDAAFGPDSDSAAYSQGGDLWVVHGLGSCDASTTLTKIVAGGTEPDWSPAALQAPPIAHSFTLTKAPVVSGIARPGRTLRASTGSWSPAPASYTFSWYRNGRLVAGRTKATYAVGRADIGTRIKVRVTVRRGGWTTRSADSAARLVRR
ncbi:MAG TPA: hypothetical protein VJ872_08160 [Nocardioides sp.]|nr:hypothetical protein [Nocardioides sp.]